MKKIVFLLLAFFGVLLAKADLTHYALEAKLGESIRVKLELQENNFGVLAGQSTYYRKNGSQSVISVFGYRIDNDDDATLLLNEFDGIKICGDFTLTVKDGEITEGRWALNDKSYEMNSIVKLSPDYSQRFFHPVSSASKAVGEYGFTYVGINGDERGGHCTLKMVGNRLKWDMQQATPGLAQGTGTSVFADSGFKGREGTFKFEAYVDERFVYVKHLNPEDGGNEDWGAWATLQGLYVRKGIKTTSTIPAK